MPPIAYVEEVKGASNVRCQPYPGVGVMATLLILLGGS